MSAIAADSATAMLEMGFTVLLLLAATALRTPSKAVNTWHAAAQQLLCVFDALLDVLLRAVLFSDGCRCSVDAGNMGNCKVATFLHHAVPCTLCTRLTINSIQNCTAHSPTSASSSHLQDLPVEGTHAYAYTYTYTQS
jgi:hypothetical protein